MVRHVWIQDSRMKIKYSIRNKFSKFIYAVAVLFQLMPIANVSAISSYQKQLFQQGIYYFNDDANTSSFFNSADGILQLVNDPSYSITYPSSIDPATEAKNIEAYIKSTNPTSPFVNMGMDYVNAGMKFGVNPALMVAISRKESSFGTNQPEGSHDAWGLTAQGDVSGYPYRNGIYYFPSWVVGINEATKYVADGYVNANATYYSRNIAEMMSHYTPGADNGRAATINTLTFMQPIIGDTSSSYTANQKYTNPFPDGWIPSRLDMGYDGNFTNRIVAPCSGTITYVYPNRDYNGGWNGPYFTLRCSTPPAGLPSDTQFYFAEGLKPTVVVNQKVNVGDTIATAQTMIGGSLGEIEWGLASISVPALTYMYAGKYCSNGVATPEGRNIILNFSKWVQNNLSLPPPATTGDAGCT
jgi:hypothetical protein